MAKAASVYGQPNKALVCYYCGAWPGTMYMNYNDKNGARLCERCVKNGRYVDGKFVLSTDTPVAPATE